MTYRRTIPLGFPVNLDLKGVFRSLSVGALEETDDTNEADFAPLPEKYFREKPVEQCWEKNLCPPRLLENKETFIIFSLLQLSAQKDKKKYKGH